MRLIESIFLSKVISYNWVLLLVGLLYFNYPVTGQTQSPNGFSLSTELSSLEINNDGRMELVTKAEGYFSIWSDNGNWWSLKLWKPSSMEQLGKTVEVYSSDQKPIIQFANNSGTLRYEKIFVGQEKLDIDLSVTVSVEGNAYLFIAKIENLETEWVVREIKVPDLNNISDSENPLTVYWPNGLGERFEDALDFGSRSFTYPSGSATMPWFALANSEGGIYIGAHDVDRNSKRFHASYNEESGNFKFDVTQFPFANGKIELPPIILQPYRGSWHTASKIYREWFDMAIPLYPSPEWVRHGSGWLLTILKQQNGEVMWEYGQMDELCDVADEWNLDVIGLFGWAHGGHDYLYPDYYPDPLMGGTQKLKEALKLAKERGKRTILYANGQLIDTSTDYYRYNGNDVIAVDERRLPYVFPIRKFNSATPMVFSKACMGAERWRQRMMELAIQAYELGADGILYDQVGVIGPSLCFSEGHLHETPATAYTTSRYEMLKQIAEHMRKIDPEFIIMSEGVIDSFLESVAYSHGWGEGFNLSNPFILAGVEDLKTQNDLIMDQSNSFPELFRFTFPEHVMTQRHATPMQDRKYANYACLYGLRHELESRYKADVKYLTENIIPDHQSYADPAYYTPDVDLMNSISPEEAKSYMHTLIEFQRAFKNILWDGKFIDNQGLRVHGRGAKAKAYKSENFVGVLIWNYSNSAQTISVEMDGYTYLEAHEPDMMDVDVQTPLAPQSIRLLIWGKTP
ncbi:MAG: hypothetical protein JJU28_12965 [Cyclobacteriaceae bacterium]|nr:hypothetical protein [Cyclobacteriaceae bacterium]